MSREHNSRLLLNATDGLMALVLAVGAVVLANQHSMPQGLGEFLKLRITPLNASFLIVFAVLWHQCMDALGLYRRVGGLRRFTLVTTTGVGIMTALLALYLEARRAEGP